MLSDIRLYVTKVSVVLMSVVAPNLTISSSKLVKFVVILCQLKV